MILYLCETAEWGLMALQTLIDWFLVCVLVELEEERGKGIQVVQSIPMIFVVIHYLSSVYIKAFSYSTCFCPVIVQNYSKSTIVPAILIFLILPRCLEQEAKIHLNTPGMAYFQITETLSRAYECTVSRTQRIRKTGER